MPQRLGQHFLNNKSFLEKIVNALNTEKGDFIIANRRFDISSKLAIAGGTPDILSIPLIIEIGSGHGELTKEIRNQKPESKIIAIEKDKKMANFLKENLKSDKNIEIIEGDVLKILPQTVSKSTIHNPRYKIIGNIPYYITGYLFRIIANLEPKPKTIVFTIQKEVAERIIAKEGMNILSASVQFWAKPEIIDYIPKTAFSPQPKVDSAIIKLTPNDEQQTIENKEKYYHLIKILFKQPRKTILNNISAGFKEAKSDISKRSFDISSKIAIEEILKKADINPSHRPQNLTINQIIALSTLF